MEFQRLAGAPLGWNQSLEARRSSTLLKGERPWRGAVDQGTSLVKSQHCEGIYTLSRVERVHLACMVAWLV
jgi:hypothetical protein